MVAATLPAGAQAADSTYLSLDPAKVAPGWKLGGAVMSARSYAATDIFGLTLTRSFLAGRGEETHALRAHHQRSTISFDGRTGSWRTSGQVGTVAVIDMRVEAAGPAVAVDELLGCRGELTRTTVALTGTLVLRTGTRFFGTVRRTRLTGTVTSTSSPLDCKVAAATVCEQSSSLYAGSPKASVNASRRSLVLQFSEALRVTTQGTVNWYHVLRAGGYDALAGASPALTATAPRGTRIRGKATFAVRSTSETTAAGCRLTSMDGTAIGTFGATFTGWGERTLRLGPRAFAVYRETR
jgi:hypothetical protein